MDKKNVQKRKPKILLCKNRGCSPFYFQFAGVSCIVGSSLGICSKHYQIHLPKNSTSLHRRQGCLEACRS